MTTKLLWVTIRPLIPQSRIKSVKNILVSNVQGLFQIHEGPLALNPIIILQGVPNDLTYFFNGSLQRIEHQIIMLVSNDSQHDSNLCFQLHNVALSPIKLHSPLSFFFKSRHYEVVAWATHVCDVAPKRLPTQ